MSALTFEMCLDLGPRKMLREIALMPFKHIAKSIGVERLRVVNGSNLDGVIGIVAAARAAEKHGAGTDGRNSFARSKSEETNRRTRFCLFC